MKIRLLAMGSILSVLSAGLVLVRGVETTYFGLLAIGVVLLVLGTLLK